MRLVSLLLLFSAVSACKATAQDDKTLIKNCFEGYKAAILEDRGKDALKFVDSKTISYYSGILEKVKKYDSAQIEQTPIIDKLTILMLRHRATKEEIMKLDGKTLLVFAIGRGMVGKNSVQKNGIGEVVVTGNSGTGQIVVDGNATPLKFAFNKEEGAWKLDLTSIFPASNIAFKNAIKESGQNENEYLFYMLEMTTEKEPTAEIWKPLEK